MKKSREKEKDIENEIRLAMPDNVRIFRNNVGMGWAGDAARTKTGDIIIRNPRPLHAGLCVGSSDEIGWCTIEITPDMVGKKIAVFLAIECKTKTGKKRKEQANFINNVIKSGGIAGICRSVEDAEKLVKNWKHGVE
jgi:hypothetical protein